MNPFRLLFIVLSVVFIAEVSAQDCSLNYSIEKTNTTCLTGSDGSIEITPVLPNSGSCLSAENAPADMCSEGTEIRENKYYQISSGEHLRIPEDFEFTGGIMVNGGTLTICGSAHIQDIELLHGQVFITGTLYTDHLNASDNFGGIKNYGQIVVKYGGGFSSVLENHGSITVNEIFNVHQAGRLDNYASMYVGGLGNNGLVRNYNNLEFLKGTMYINQGSKLENYCKIIVKENFEINSVVDNKGQIVVESRTRVNSGASLNLFKGAYLKTKDIEVNAAINSENEGCALLEVTSESVINWGASVHSNIFYCDVNGVETNHPNIELNLNCECPYVNNSQQTIEDFTFLWHQFPELGSVNYVENLSVGTYNITISDGNCSRDVSVFVPGPNNPIRISAITTPNLCSETSTGRAEFSVSGGSSEYQYSFNGNASNSLIYENLSGGSYVFKVTDSEGCVAEKRISIYEGDEIEIKVEVTDESCEDAGDGEVTLSVNSELCGEADGENGENGKGCYEGGLPDSDACLAGCHKVFSGENNYALSGSEKACIKDLFTGNVDFVNGNNVLNVCGVANFNHIVLKRKDKIINYGVLNVISIKLDRPDAEIINYGEINYSGDLNIEAFVTNYGTINGSVGNLNVESIGKLENYGSITVAGSFHNNQGFFQNEGPLNLGNSLICNGSSVFVNTCNITVAKRFIIHDNSVFENYGVVSGVNETFFSPLSQFVVHPGSELSTSSINLNRCTIVNEGASCGKITSSTTVFDSPVFNGKIYFCDLNNTIELDNGHTFLNGAKFECECLGSEEEPEPDQSEGEFVWDDGYVGKTRSGLKAGTYSVSLSCGECSASESFEVKTKSDFSAEAKVTNESCKGKMDGKLEAIVSGFDFDDVYQVYWTTPKGQVLDGEEVYDLEAGLYSLKVVNDHGCTFLKEDIEVGYDDEACFSDCLNARAEISSDNVSCGQLDNGKAFLNLKSENHSVSETYWYDIDGEVIGRSLSVNNLRPGDYLNKTYFKYENRTCYREFPFSVGISPGLEVAYETVSPCKTDEGGEISLNITGGVKPYSINWSHSMEENTEHASSLSSGKYDVVVKDNSGCSVGEEIVLSKTKQECSECDKIKISVEREHISCYGLKDGKITVHAGTNTVPLNTTWRQDDLFYSDNLNISALDTGLYSLSAQFKVEGFTCDYTKDVRVESPQELTVNGHSVVQPSGPGCKDGSVAVFVEGGTPDYEFTWSGSSENMSEIKGISDGNISVDILDQNGCSANFQTSLSPVGKECKECANLSVGEGSDNITCYGYNDGAVQLNGLSNYEVQSIQWFGPNGFTSSSEKIEGLSKGAYEAVVDIKTGTGVCLYNPVVVVTEPKNLKPFVRKKAPICKGGANGWILLDNIGGTAPIQVTWENRKETSIHLNSIPSGTYAFSLKDGNMCSYSDIVDLDDSKRAACRDCDLYDVNYSLKEPSCFGESNGRIVLNFKPGETIKDLKWIFPDGSTSFDKSIYGLRAGKYELTFKVILADGQECKKEYDIYLKEPKQLQIQTVRVTHPSIGKQNGSVAVRVSGGTGSLRTYWPSLSYVGTTASGFGKGTHSVILSDENKCRTSRDYTLDESESAPACQDVIANLHKKDITCRNDQGGELHLELKNQDEVNYIEWIGPGYQKEGVRSIYGLPAGEYTVNMEVVKNETVCNLSRTEVLNAAPSVNIDFRLVNNTCSEYPNGEAYAIVSGLKSPATYVWEEKVGDVWNMLPSNSISLHHLRSGLYRLNVYGSDGCSANKTFNIEKDGNAGCNPCDNIVLRTIRSDNNCYGERAGSVELFYTAGTEVSSIQWKKDGSLYSETQHIGNLAEGFYELDFVAIIEDSTCTYTRGVPIYTPEPISVTYAVNDPGCDGEAYGKIQLLSEGGTANHEYYWGLSGEIASFKFIDSPGSYDYSITDGNGCLYENFVKVNSFSKSCPPVSIGITVTPPSPPQQSDDEGPVVTLVSSYPPNSTVTNITWETPTGETISNTDQLTNCGSGVYVVTVTVVTDDGETFSVTEQFVIEEDLPVGVHVGNNSNNSNPTPTPEGGDGNPPYVTTITACNTRGPVNITVNTPTGTTGVSQESSSTSDNDNTTVTVTDSRPSNGSTTIPPYTNAPADEDTCASAYFKLGYENITCREKANGALHVRLPDDVENVSFHSVKWRRNSNINEFFGYDSIDLSGLMPDRYTAVVELEVDGKVCPEQQLSHTLYEALPFLISFQMTPESCEPGHDGVLIVKTNNVNRPFQYEWSHTPLNTDTVSGLTSASYYVSVKDNNNCTASKSKFVRKESSSCGCDNFEFSVKPQNVTCKGLSNGSAKFNLPEGSELTSARWFKDNAPIPDTEGLAEIDGLSGGVYKVDVNFKFQGVSCSKGQTFSITEPKELTLNLNPTNTSGLGCNDGMLIISASGGSGILHFEVNNEGVTQNSLKELSAGTYYVTVSDTNECKKTDYAVIKEGSKGCGVCADLEELISGKLILCDADDIGKVNVSFYSEANGQTYNPQITWRYPDQSVYTSSEGISNLQPGFYHYETQVLYAGEVCPMEDSVRVVRSEPLVLQDSVTHVSCADLSVNDGEINVDVSGGSGRYFYYWNKSKEFSRKPSMGGLAPGVHHVLVKDSYNCSISKDVLVERNMGGECGPCAFFPVEVSSVSPDCETGSNGEIIVNLNGLDPSGIDIKWDYPISRTGDKRIRNLDIGEYSVTVSDDSTGCSLFKNISLDIPEVFIYVPEEFDELGEQIYVKDVSSCDANDGEIDLTGKILAFDLDDNPLNFIPQGENDFVVTDPDYCQVIWYDENEENVLGTGPKLSNLAPGVYNADIICGSAEQGNSSCTDYEFEVGGGIYAYVDADEYLCEGEILELFIETNAGEDSDCEDCVYWESPSGQRVYSEYAAFENPEAGVYKVFATLETSEELCEHEESVNITISPKPVLAYTAQHNVCAEEEIIAEVETDIPSTFHWENVPGLSSRIINNPVIVPETSASYGFEATAIGTGCVTEGSIAVSVKQNPEVNVAQNVNACYDGEVQLSASGGASYAWSPQNMLNNASISNPIAKLTSNQVFTVSITGGNGCVVERDVNVNVYPAFNPVAEVVFNACLDDGFQLIVTEGQSYRWSPSESLSADNIRNPVHIGFSSENYSVEVTNSNNCMAVATVEVPTLQMPSAGDDVPVCYGEAAQLEGKNAVSYNWSPAAGLNNPNIANPSVNVSSNVTYTLRATDAYGCVRQDEVTVIFDAKCRCEGGESPAIAWTGKGGNSNWNNPLNWYPETVPSAESNVVIKYEVALPGEGEDNVYTVSTFPVLSENIHIKDLCMMGGSLNLNGRQFTVNGNGTYTGGVVKGDGEFLMKNNSQGQSAFFAGTRFESVIKVEECPSIYLNGSEFATYTYLEQKGSAKVESKGNNKFSGETFLVNSGTGDWYLSSMPQADPDVYEGEVTFQQKSSGKIYPTALNRDYYKGNIYLVNSDITFGKRGGEVVISGLTNQSLEAEDLDGYPSSVANFSNLYLEKAVNNSLNKFYISVPAYIGLGASPGKLKLEKGNIVTNTDAVLTVSRPSTISGYSRNSFIEGPVKKIATNRFEFPLGKDQQYNPLTVQASMQHDYLVEFVGEPKTGVYLGENNEIKSVSECEHFKVSADYDEAFIATLGFDRRSCDILNNLSLMRVAVAAGQDWVSLGNDFHTGSKGSGGAIKAQLSPAYADWNLDQNYLALGSVVIPGEESPTGFSFNNYGVKVNVGDGYSLNVYGNVLNEQRVSGSLAADEDQGRFKNEGTIIVESDWTNNAENLVFANIDDENLPQHGLVILDGNAQRLRGRNATQFYHLYTQGNGIKSMFADVSVNGLLRLNNVELATRNKILHINTSQYDAIERDEIGDRGFISSRKDGFLKRDIMDDNMNDYLFPVGSGYLYRPLYLSPLRGAEAGLKTFSVRMVQKNPDYDNYLTTVRSPTVSGINTDFYHIIRKDDQVEQDPENADNYNDLPVNLKLLFSRRSDGTFQSVAHWKNEPEEMLTSFPVNGEMLRLYPVNAQGNSIRLDDPSGKYAYWKNVLDYDLAQVFFESNSNYADRILDRVIVQNYKNFDTEVFALGKAGFVMQTNSFGDPAGSDNAVGFSMSGDQFNTAQSEGDFTAGSPVFETGAESGDDDGVNAGHTVTPMLLAGEHIMEIHGNFNNIPGRIRIVTNDQGQVVRNNDQYRIYFIDQDDQEHLLSPELYDVYFNDRLISWHSSGSAREPVSCSGIKIQLNEQYPFMLFHDTDQFIVNGISGELIDYLKISASDQHDAPVYMKTGTEVISSPFDGKQNGIDLPEGVYFFQLKVGEEYLNGQFIISR
ncbi:hypothetical protein RCC89_05015 [Cytophagaceae bacterium ABcell3]|nr:hypothetical protein RCC89_05015 [Cytophagaceae bacterium ABcell3]